jgi:heptosyltransferase-2
MGEVSSKNILIIQTAFIGDTILASSFAKSVSEKFPEMKIHFFLRKGNESVRNGEERWTFRNVQKR